MDTLQGSSGEAFVHEHGERAPGGVAGVPVPDRRNAVVAVVVGALAAAVLFALRTRTLLPDGVQYCLDARSGVHLFHPHHLLYTATLHGAWRLVCAILPQAGVVPVAQAIGAFAGAALLVAVFRLVLRVTESRAAALLAALVPAASHGFWALATQPEPFVVTAAFALWTLVVLVHRPCETHVRRLLVASLLTLTVAFHQAGLLLAPALLFLAHDRAFLRVRDVISIVAVAGVLVLGLYVLAYAVEPEPTTLLGFARFCLRYAVDGPAEWGGAQHLGPAGVLELARSLAWNAGGPRAASSMPLVLLGSGAAIGIAVVAIWRTRGTIRARAFAACCACWFALILLFFAWWLPGQAKYLSFALAPLAGLAGVLAARASERVGTPAAQATGTARFRFAGVRVAAIALVVLLAVNVVGSVLPAHALGAPLRARAREIEHAIPRGAVVLLDVQTGRLGQLFEGPRAPLNVELVMHLFRTGEAATLLRGGADPLAGAPVIAIPAAELSPGFVAHDVDGFAQPDGWWAFLTWLFDLRFDAEAGDWSHRALSAQKTASGWIVVVLTQERTRVARAADMLERLDVACADDPACHAHPFRAWARQFSERR